MPKQKTSPNQPTFFQREVPQMPEGYYSSGLNPNLRKFVEDHAKPYDPETDDYNVPTFAKPITTTKATAIYNMHTYWSKKPHDAIQQYIRHYTQPGDLVLDPFCGSGGTALAALMEGRAAIAIDLSPAATFITKNYCTPVDVDKLQRAFEDLKAKVKPEMDWLYETRCDRCDGKATITYTVYSQIFQCPRCLEKVVLFDCIQLEGLTSKGKKKLIRVCPICYKKGHKEEIRSQSKKFGYLPVLVNFLCNEGCKPQRQERCHNDSNPKKQQYFNLYDLGKLKEIQAKKIPYWYPVDFDMTGFNRYQRDALWLYGVREVADLFTRRNIWALGLLFTEIKKIQEPYASALMFTVSSFLLNLTKLYKHREGGGGQPTGNYYVPQIHRENEAWSAFERKYTNIQAGLLELPEILNGNTNVIVSTQSALSLKEIPEQSIDHIFTDPPYAGKYQYGELNFVWEAWLGLNTNWHSGEVIVNETRHVTDEDWAAMMLCAMQECFRVLKPGRWLALCYHDTSEGTWSMVQDIMAQAGFIADRSEEALFIDTGQKTYNQTQGEKVTQRDLVINFRKPLPGEISQKIILTGNEDTATFFEKARAILVDVLEAHPGSSADRLYDDLVSRMVRRGEFQRHNFDELLRSVAEPVSHPVMKNLFEPADPDLFGSHESIRWYLLETAWQLDEAESIKENAAFLRLEKFMNSWLSAHPGESGVHYSDLFEQYLPIRDKPRRLLIEWLPEFFFKTAEGTWRLPADEVERTQLADLRSSGLLRRVKRFGNALLEGVPPHERDLPESPATLADWIRQCRRAGLYEIGRVLFEKSGSQFDGLDEVRQIELEEDYQVCVRRIEVKPIVKKKKQPSLLDEE